jgi:methionyl-tRNA formyltransferase
LKDPVFLSQLANLKPDLQVVVAFRMLPKEVWALPPLGTFNMHASLLPQYRGAAPINHAIINGETSTGVTTFFLEEKIDTGKIIFSQEIQILPEEDAGELHDKLMMAGADLVIRTIRGIIAGEVSPADQDRLVTPGIMLKGAPRFTRDDFRINWNQDAKDVFNMIRGMSPYPGAFTNLVLPDGTPIHLKVLKASLAIEPQSCEPGKILSDGRTFLRICAKNGTIDLIMIQPAGRRTMTAKEFLNGFGRHFT